MKFLRIILSIAVVVATAATAWATSVVVDGTHVRLRLGPSTNHSILTNGNGNPIYPAKGATLTYIATEGDFYKVKYKGYTCYISRDFSHLSDDVATVKATTKMDKKLVGKHLLSLQWISWDYYGSVNITKVGPNRYRCVGQQLDRDNVGDYLKIDGYLSAIDELNLVFTGEIRTKINYINGGNEYLRSGTFTFKSTQGRRYWRMQEMLGADGVTDYVDIYMKR